jgi:hypothetical protein
MCIHVKTKQRIALASIYFPIFFNILHSMMEKGYVPSSFLWKIRSDGTKKKKKRTPIEKKEGGDGKEEGSILTMDRIENRKKLTDLLNPQSRLKDVSFLFDSHASLTKTHIEGPTKVEKGGCSVALCSARANDIPNTKIPPEFFIYETTTVLDSADEDDEVCISLFCQHSIIIVIITIFIIIITIMVIITESVVLYNIFHLAFLFTKKR